MYAAVTCVPGEPCDATECLLMVTTYLKEAVSPLAFIEDTLMVSVATTSAEYWAVLGCSTAAYAVHIRGGVIVQIQSLDHGVHFLG